MSEVILEIEPGRYEIGSDRVLNASPRHNRLLQNTIWVLAKPFSVIMFQKLLQNVDLIDRLGEFRSIGKDSRVKQLFENSRGVSRSATHQQHLADVALTGLNLFESNGIAMAMGGRIPNEFEWEIAATKLKLVTVNIQEWTCDEFTPKYWRSEIHSADKKTHPDPRKQVSIRGFCYKDLHKHFCFRQGDFPDSIHRFRGFRIAWDSRPNLINILSDQQ